MLGLVVRADADFTSLYVFGDGVSTTTSNTVGPAVYYYGLRYCNGRVWVEQLAQQLGLTNNFWYSNNVLNRVAYTNLTATSTNWSYSGNDLSFYGDYSSTLMTNLNQFSAPPNVSNALFIVWVNDADFVGYMTTSGYSPYTTNNIAIWTNSIAQSISNHFAIITNLYAKGARTLVMPNAVDITAVPYFSGNSAANKNFVRLRVIDFNNAFAITLSNAMALHSDLKIYEPNFFSLLDNLLTNAAAYGLTNAQSGGHTIDAVDDPNLSNKALNGPGTNYIFWDYLDPSAKAQAVMASTVRQMLSPAGISQITALGSSNRLDLAGAPVGLNGVVESRTNLASGYWTTSVNFNATSPMQAVFVPMSGSQQFYRLNIPFSWSWP